MGRKSRRKTQRTSEERPPSPEPRPIRSALSPAESRRIAPVCAVLVVLVATIFSQLRDHQFLHYDDDIYVTRNDHVRAGLTAAGVRWAFTSMDFNWHPVTWLTHMLDVELFGLHAGPHLLMNTLLHALNAVLLFLLLLRATRRFWPSACVAALFAVHPLHVESVAWLSERKDVLSTLFFLLTVLLYMGWVERRSWTAYAALIVTFALGLMSKGMLVTLPFILLLLDYWPLERLTSRKDVGRLLLEKLPLFALVVPSVVLTYKAQEAVHAVGKAWNVPLSIRMANAALSYVAYLVKTAWPWPLAIPYPYPSVISPSRSVLAALLLVAISATIFALAKWRPYLFTGWFWFVGSLVPVIGLVQIGVQSMADRYTYIPLIGLFIAAVWLVDSVVAVKPRLRIVASIAAGVLVAIFTAVAHAQAAYWRDTETLFRHSLAVTRNNYAAHLALGTALIEKNDLEGAVRELESAVEINALSAGAHHDLAAAYARLGRADEAAVEYRKAIALDPNDQRSQMELAALALQRGDVQDALARYSEVVRLQPQSAAAHNDLAAALSRAGRDDDALRAYEQALRLDASLYDAHMNVGALLSRRNRAAEAVSHLESAKKLQPQSTEPHVYLALVLAQSGRLPEAILEAEAAIAIDEATANAQFSEAVRIAPAPDNLRGFIASLRGR